MYLNEIIDNSEPLDDRYRVLLDFEPRGAVAHDEGEVRDCTRQVWVETIVKRGGTRCETGARSRSVEGLSLRHERAARSGDIVDLTYLNEIIYNFEVLDDRSGDLISFTSVEPSAHDVARTVHGCASQVWVETISNCDRPIEALAVGCERAARLMDMRLYLWI